MKALMADLIETTNKLNAKCAAKQRAESMRTKPHLHRLAGRWCVKWIGRAIPAYFECHKWTERMNG